MNEYFMSRWYSPETVSFRGEAFTGICVSQEKMIIDSDNAYMVAEEGENLSSTMQAEVRTNAVEKFRRRRPREKGEKIQSRHV
jgi:hypothetical protein